MGEPRRGPPIRDAQAWLGYYNSVKGLGWSKDPRAPKRAPDARALPAVLVLVPFLALPLFGLIPRRGAESSCNRGPGTPWSTRESYYSLIALATTDLHSALSCRIGAAGQTTNSERAWSSDCGFHGV